MSVARLIGICLLRFVYTVDTSTERKSCLMRETGRNFEFPVGSLLPRGRERKKTNFSNIPLNN